MAHHIEIVRSGPVTNPWWVAIEKRDGVKTLLLDNMAFWAGDMHMTTKRAKQLRPGVLVKHIPAPRMSVR